MGRCVHRMAGAWTIQLVFQFISPANQPYSPKHSPTTTTVRRVAQGSGLSCASRPVAEACPLLLTHRKNQNEEFPKREQETYNGSRGGLPVTWRLKGTKKKKNAG